MKFINGCETSAIEALRYLANNPRPKGGQEHYNAEHLLQIADELEASLKPQSKEVRVTIEIKGLDPLVVEYEKHDFMQERGLNYVYANPWCPATDIVYNGHERMSIRLWTGCETFETFNPGSR